ncbi:PREDICTED: transcription factor HIVEP3-like [Ceratosolen solmsi marchali]|uniref:Transcription factor HIVEP3-like n=1 Tax=Ceratosolen solmsi marchali TaxID=326594 RepID=A0AAJ7DU39_9HYME|nr:PREDICTED: transcription factor HIVEP3-like [Ceratosolen solmsi marchali]
MSGCQLRDEGSSNIQSSMSTLSTTSWYVQPDSSTNILGVVFNYSSTSTPGSSPNDIMHIRPNLNPDRSEYMQIKTHKDNWDNQRTLWIDEQQGSTLSVDDSHLHFQGRPFLAIRTRLQLIEGEGSTHPLTMTSITQGKYVADISGSANKLEQGPVGEVGGIRLPLQSLHGYGSVFMYSASTSTGGSGGVVGVSSGVGGITQSGSGSSEVTLRQREPEDIPEEMLARLEDTATLSISLQGDALLRLGADTTGNGNLELFDSESGPDLTLSPQTFTSTAEAFINDNSDSLGVPGDNDTGSGEESRTGMGDPSKLGVKKPRPKASSPNRQGPQQCQVCGKVFNNASALTKHKLTHSDERKYVCTMCGKAFKRQDHLNGHMLTHRNKKPYECKAEGCGKSYCDARSLRRHTENHHAGSKVNESTSPSSPVTGPNTPNTPGSNPSTPSTPGTVPTSAAQNGHGHTALKQLLASEPASTQLKGSNGLSNSNDSLTKQQLELIQQIMQQTQQQQQIVQSQSQPHQHQQQHQQSTNETTISGQVQKNGLKPLVKSTTTILGPIVNSVSANIAANARSSPKSKIWNHVQLYLEINGLLIRCQICIDIKISYPNISLE